MEKTFKISGKLIALIVVALTIVVMFVTVPDKSAHVQAITDSVMATVPQDSLKTKDGIDMSVLGPNLIKKVLESKLEVANYGVVSVGSVQNEKKKQTISVGAFGHVFVGDVDKKSLDKAMK